MTKLEAVILLLLREEALPVRLRDHALTGNWAGFRDCHIQPDWLLIYKVDGERLHLARTGTHADLFDRQVFCEWSAPPMPTLATMKLSRRWGTQSRGLLRAG